MGVSLTLLLRSLPLSFRINAHIVFVVSQKRDWVMYWSREKNSTFTGLSRKRFSFSRLKQMNALESSSNSTKALPRADSLIVDVFFKSFRVGKMNDTILPNFLSSSRTSC